jgi:ribosomal protein S18 acetylase RimI-like enzyme
MVRIRRASEADLAQVAAVQQASPEAARWDVAEYLRYDFWVADFYESNRTPGFEGGRIAGFLVARTLTEGEREVLNLAVMPAFRRQGVARELLDSFLGMARGAVYLEVRESNRAAREFYKSMGFKMFSQRSGYYDSPGGLVEPAIVMKFHSC